jgi:hypothetical protein
MRARGADYVTVQMIAPSMQAIEELSLRIKLLDREIGSAL